MTRYCDAYKNIQQWEVAVVPLPGLAMPADIIS